MGPSEHPRTLLDKALEDERVMLLLCQSEGISDESIGFHAQQAVEKGMKAVLAARGVRYRRTHELAELLDMLDERQIEHPADLDDTVALTPFATSLRYDYLPEEAEEEPFDRAQACRWVRLVLDWAQGVLDQIPHTDATPGQDAT